MKYLLPVIALIVLIPSCKKEMKLPYSFDLNDNRLFFQTTKMQLKDSLGTNDYLNLDTTQMYTSKDAQKGVFFVRIAILNKNIATDFILLKTDSSGNIMSGKFIHVDKSEDMKKGDNYLFQGQFIITSLNRKESNEQQVVNGRWKHQTIVNSMMETQEEPVGEQELPDVVVTSYSNDGGYMADWYWYGGFFDDYGNMGGTYMYGSAGGGGGSSSPSSHGGGNDNTITIEVEPNDDEAIKVEDYLKCFSTVPDANATYQITLYADIPVNGDPSELFNTNTGEVGHSFIQLVKSSGNMRVQQSLGFYPHTSWKSLSTASVDSKVVDNEGHEFNASLTTSLNSTEFGAAMGEIQSMSAKDYNITTWNCTDFALDVFNAANTGQTLTIPRYPIPGTSTYSNTPQGLYVTIENMKSNGNDSYGTVDIPGVCGYVGNSHGSCGD